MNNEIEINKQKILEEAAERWVTICIQYLKHKQQLIKDKKVKENEKQN
jgi:hypothetical protein